MWSSATEVEFQTKNWCTGGTLPDSTKLYTTNTRHRSKLQTRHKRNNIQDASVTGGRGKDPSGDLSGLSGISHAGADKFCGHVVQSGVLHDDRAGLANQLDGHGAKELTQAPAVWHPTGVDPVKATVATLGDAPSHFP